MSFKTAYHELNQFHLAIDYLSVGFFKLTRFQAYAYGSLSASHTIMRYPELPSRFFKI